MVVLADVARVVDVAHVQNHVLVAPRQREDVVVGGKRVVHTARQAVVGDLRRDHRVGRVGQVEDHDSVAPIRGPFARHCRVASVGRHLHVVHGARVDLDRIRLDDVGGIGHVPHETVAVGALGPGDRVVAPVHALEDPEVGGAHPLFPAVAVDLELLDHITGDDLEGGARGEGPGVGHHRVDARQVGDEAAAVHLRRRWRGDASVGGFVGVVPLDGDTGEELAAAVLHLGAEVDDVAGAGAGNAADDCQGASREGVDGEGGRACHAVDRGGDGGRAGGGSRDAPEAVDGRNAGRVAPPLDLGIGTFAAVCVLGPDPETNRGSREQTVVGERSDDHPRDGRPVDADRHPDHDRFACRSASTLNQGRDQRVVPRLQRGDDTLPHPHRRARAHQPHGRGVHLRAGAGHPRDLDLHFVAHAHGQLRRLGHELHDGVVIGLGSQRERGGGGQSGRDQGEESVTDAGHVGSFRAGGPNKP